MSEIYKYQEITELTTPVGTFRVFSDEEKIPFSVNKNYFDIPYSVYDKNNNVIGTIHTETNFTIEISTSQLRIGKEYTISFDNGKWEYCESDEHTTCFNTVIDNWAVGIGAYDPNDQEKDNQAWNYSEKMGFLKQKYVMEPPEYNETNFTRHSVYSLDDCNGYKFKLYDYSQDKVTFEVAWVKIEEFPAIEYEGALGFWLC